MTKYLQTYVSHITFSCTLCVLDRKYKQAGMINANLCHNEKQS